jgi:hypothetical protein
MPYTEPSQDVRRPFAFGQNLAQELIAHPTAEHSAAICLGSLVHRTMIDVRRGCWQHHTSFAPGRPALLQTCR